MGKALRQRLGKAGITLIGELVRIDKAYLVARYGKIGRRLALCARGEDDRRVDPEGKAKRLSSEITLGQAARCLNQRRAREMDGRGRGGEALLRAPGPPGTCCDLASPRLRMP